MLNAKEDICFVRVHFAKMACVNLSPKREERRILAMYHSPTLPGTARDCVRSQRAVLVLKQKSDP